MCVNNSRDTVTLNTIHVPNIQNLARSGISQLKLNVALLSVSERRQFLPQRVDGKKGHKRINHNNIRQEKFLPKLGGIMDTLMKQMSLNNMLL